MLNWIFGKEKNEADEQEDPWEEYAQGLFDADKMAVMNKLKYQIELVSRIGKIYNLNHPTCVDDFNKILNEMKTSETALSEDDLNDLLELLKEIRKCNLTAKVQECENIYNNAGLDKKGLLDERGNIIELDTNVMSALSKCREKHKVGSGLKARFGRFVTGKIAGVPDAMTNLIVTTGEYAGKLAGSTMVTGITNAGKSAGLWLIGQLLFLMLWINIFIQITSLLGNFTGIPTGFQTRVIIIAFFILQTIFAYMKVSGGTTNIQIGITLGLIFFITMIITQGLSVTSIGISLSNKEENQSGIYDTVLLVGHSIKLLAVLVFGIQFMYTYLTNKTDHKLGNLSLYMVMVLAISGIVLQILGSF